MYHTIEDLTARRGFCFLGTFIARSITMDVDAKKRITEHSCVTTGGSRMKKAVHFGPGGIGMGLFGQLYYESGYETVFVGRNPEKISLINQYRSYPLEILNDAGESKEVVVKNVRAMSVLDEDAVSQEIVDADIISTAVGASNLRSIAEPLAKGLCLRWEKGNLAPINVLLGENMVETGQRFREFIENELPSSKAKVMFRDTVGAVDASVRRLSLGVKLGAFESHPLKQQVNDGRTLCLPVDKDALKAPMPGLKYIEPVGNFDFLKKLKIFVSNSGHSIRAYLGHVKGYTYMSECRENPRIIDVVYGSMMEAGRATCKEFGMPFEDVEAGIKQRVSDMAQEPSLDDPISRVARQPLRKLADNERLMGGAKLAVKHGMLPLNLCLSTAAALHFYDPADESSVRLQSMISTDGPDKVLKEVCNIDEDSPLFPLILSSYDLLGEGLLL